MTRHIYAGRKTLVLTMAEIKSLLSMKTCLQLQKTAFIAHARGRALNAPNTWLRLPAERKWMKLLAGYIADVQGLGMKVLARFPANPPGMNLGSIVALFDPADGFPLAIMDAVFITAIRTGAGGGLSALYCARKNCRSVGILGSGVQARFNLLALREVMPEIMQARVFSRSRSNREEFARVLQRETGIAIDPVETVEEAIAETDLILTATNSPVPILKPEHVHPGVHILAMGIKTEIDPSVFAGTRVIADGRQVSLEDGKFSVALQAGLVSEMDLCGEIGEVLDGTLPGRTKDTEVTVFDSSGLAVQDVICAHFVYEAAQKQGLGTAVDLGLGEFP